jgi:hypothetical protein
LAQFPFQYAILKIERQNKGRTQAVRSLLFCSDSDLAMPTQINESGTELSALRRQITELVARNAVVMVQNAIDAVNEAGQYQAIKYLFEMIGLYPALGSEAEPGEASLTGTLLHHLGIQEMAATKDAPRGPNESLPLNPLQ